MTEFSFQLNYIDRKEKEINPKEQTIKALEIIGLECADVAIKWGPRFAEMDHIAILRSKAFELGQEIPDITIIADTRSDRQAVFILAGDRDGLGFHKITDPDTFDLPLPGGQIEVNTGLIPYIATKEPGFISWDINLSPQEVSRTIRALDLKAIEVGLFDDNTKVRKTNPEMKYVPLPKFKVDEVFTDIGTIQPIFDENPEKYLEQFDRPEELSIQVDNIIPTISILSLVHKRDLGFLNKRHLLATRVLEEVGFTLEDFAEGLTRAPGVFNPLVMKVKNMVNQKSMNLVRAESLRRKPEVDEELFKVMQSSLIAMYEGDALADPNIFEGGKNKLVKMANEYPDAAPIAHALGVVISNTRGAKEEVYEYFKKATEADPTKALYFYDAGRSAFDLGKEFYKEAISFFKSANELPDKTDYWASLSQDEAMSLYFGIQKLIDHYNQR